MTELDDKAVREELLHRLKQTDQAFREIGANEKTVEIWKDYHTLIRFLLVVDFNSQPETAFENFLYLEKRIRKTLMREIGIHLLKRVIALYLGAMAAPLVLMWRIPFFKRSLEKYPSSSFLGRMAQ